MRFSLAKKLALSLMMLAGVASAAGAAGPTATTSTDVEGLWLYTGLVSKGRDMPLTGVFLFKGGELLQQAVFNGEPADQQAAMAHAGTYAPTPIGVNLVTEQLIGIAPTAAMPLTFKPDVKHTLKVERAADDLKITFGSGTVQTLRRVGSGNGKVYKVPNGRFAFTDGYFVIVAGDGSAAVTGYGQYEAAGNDYRLKVIRWAEVADGKVAYRAEGETVKVRFDGTTLTLPGGQHKTVTK
ncbi:hypothetical protein ACFB49_33860 [Sphingomonas sp. DBB INV C78]